MKVVICLFLLLVLCPILGGVEGVGILGEGRGVFHFRVRHRREGDLLLVVVVLCVCVL